MAKPKKRPFDAETMVEKEAVASGPEHPVEEPKPREWIAHYEQVSDNAGNVVMRTFAVKAATVREALDESRRLVPSGFRGAPSIVTRVE